MMAPVQIATLQPFAYELEEVSDSVFARYAELIYARTGVRVMPQKRTLLSNRLRHRLRSTGIKGFEEYYNYLHELPPQDPEWDAFMQEITTHETYLFRDPGHWDWFRGEFLAKMAASARGAAIAPSLRIWSAACSTGDEAHTIACCIAACLPDFNKWSIHILGSDLGTGALEKARRGTFDERAMRYVPETYKKCYFTKVKGQNLWLAKPMLKDMMTFQQHNLLNPFPAKQFDIVFLKNVLIYFDKNSKKQVLANVKQAVRPGGRLIVTAAEGVSDLLHDFSRIQCWLYQKPMR
jgi:chemotaxis protein methyltransferase CheR